MRKLMAASTLLFVLSVSPGMAREYSWCARTPTNDFNPQCDFTSFPQCQATVSGQGGDCIRNPALAFGQMREGRNGRLRTGPAVDNGWQGGDWGRRN